MGALAELREEGKVRHVGLSNVGRSHLDTAQEIVPIVSVQNRYSLTSRDSEQVLEVCESEGIGFIPWFPLDTGSLADANGLEEVAKSHGANERAGGACLVAAALAGDGPDSRDVLDRAPRGERRRGAAEALRRGARARRGGRGSRRIAIGNALAVSDFAIDPRTRIGHVHLKVSDLERAERFYVDVLGFQVRSR